MATLAARPLPTTVPTLEDFSAEARTWLAGRLERRPARGDGWGRGSDSVAVFQSLTAEQEAALVAAAKAWNRCKFDAGYGAISWAVEHGGRGLPPAYAAAFAREESRFAAPETTELFDVTTALVAPTIGVWGTPEQVDRFVRPLLRTDLLACQLFSEPAAGSDLASLRMRAVRDGDCWVLTGQKVWTSGAHVADYGECICRTDPDSPKHAGLTAFVVPLDAAGVDVRPIRQMTGGASFNEVFLDEVRVPDALRLGPVGEGWSVALTTLANERSRSASPMGSGGNFRRVLDLARFLERAGDPVMRQRLADLYTATALLRMNGERVRARLRAGQTPGPEGSIGKLAWTQLMSATSDVVSDLLGPRLTADTGEWGTFAWTEYVLGAPGYRIAGGSDEIQRNVIAERVLGLPKDPR